MVHAEAFIFGEMKNEGYFESVCMCLCLFILCKLCSVLQGVHTVTFEIQCDVIEGNMDEWLQVCGVHVV